MKVHITTKTSAKKIAFLSAGHLLELVGLKYSLVIPTWTCQLKFVALAAEFVY